MIIPSAEPFFFPGGPTGCVLVHGFTGTPNEMRLLGEYLALKGHSVLGVRLAGHATCIEDMQRTRWQDWLASVEDSYNMLSGNTERIFLIGLSLGGVLSLTFASGKFTPACPVAGVVAMSVPQHLPIDPRLARVIKVASLIKPRNPKGPSDWHDKIAEQTQICYDEDPLRQVVELRDLLVEMNSVLPTISIPTLLIYSKNDLTVRPDENHAEIIFKGIGSHQKKISWVEGSGHVLTRDAQKDLVFARIADFITKE